MAREATARLYDVDHDSLVFKKLQMTEKYDQGALIFRAGRGKLIDLDKLHESLWATRLSDSTRSGLVSLEVTAIGRVSTSADKTTLRVADSGSEFVLGRHPNTEQAAAFAELQDVSSDKVVTLTGLVDDYMGRWPNVLRIKPKKPRRILVMHWQVLENSEDQTQ